MPKFIRNCIVPAAALAGPLTILPLYAAATDLPEAIAVSGEVLVTTVQAAGAQIYECKADVSGKLTWQFREPVATLFSNGKTVGRHFAGPQWEMADGSTVTAKVTGRAPGASGDDIPLLRLEVTAWRGTGQLAHVSTIQRINTKGGVAEGACETAGVLQNVPYTADYAFYRKSGEGTATAAPAASRSATAPRYAAPVVAVPAPAPDIHVIVLPRDIPHRRKKKRHDHDDEPKGPPKGGEPKSPPGEPKSPPTAEPKAPTTPTPPTAEPKSPAPSGPKTTGTNKPKYVRDPRKRPPLVVDDRRDRPEPVVRDHRGDEPREQKPRGTSRPLVRDHRGEDRERPEPRRPASGPIVRDQRGVERDRPKPRGTTRPAVRDHRDASTGSTGGGSSPCGASGMPPCRAQ